MKLEIPPTFKIGRFAPPPDDVAWLFAWCLLVHPRTVLEFGVGVTTLAIQEGARPSMHVAIEEHAETIQNIKAQKWPGACPHIISTDLRDVPRAPYDMVLVDSSALFIPNGADGVRRSDAVIFAETLANPDAYYLVHDWVKCGRSYTGEGPRLYLEMMGYTLVDSFTSSRGWGVYRRFEVPADIVERRERWAEHKHKLKLEKTNGTVSN